MTTTIDAPVRRRRLRIGGRVGNLALTIAAPILLFALLALLWQWTASTFKTVLPPIQEIVADVMSRPEFYLMNLGVTLNSAMTGFLIGVTVALALAAAIIQFKFLRAAIMPVALLLNVTPIVAIAPALVVAFGFSDVPRIIAAVVERRARR